MVDFCLDCSIWDGNFSWICAHIYSSFLINTSDRIIRVYDAKEVIACGKDGEPEPIQKLQDLVNK